MADASVGRPLARHSELAEQVLFNLIPTPAYIFDDQDLQFRAVNESALVRYGYTREEFLALNLLDIRPQDDRASTRQIVFEQIDQVVYRGVFRHMTRSGEVFQVEVASQPIVYDGRRSHFVVAYELTQRRRLQEALFDSRTRMQALFDNALDAILMANDDGRFVDANAAACALLVRPRDEILTLHAWDLVAGAARAKAELRWRDFLSAGKQSGDYVLAAGDGSTREVEFRAVAHVLPGLHLSILRDVTARNAARLAAEKELRDVNQRLRHMSARARARREEDRTRLSRELHDQLGQALAGLKIDLCRLADRAVPGNPVTDDVPPKLASMTALVDETILRVRRLSSELRPPVLDRLGLVAAIEWQLDEFKRRTGIQTRLETRFDHVPLDIGRSTAVFRIFQEALANAGVHAQATCVTVHLAMPSGNLVVMLTDNGRGIPPDVAESGQSLGLVGMRERAQLLGGGLVVRPAPAGGTIVTVSVPLDDRRSSPRDSW